MSVIIVLPLRWLNPPTTAFVWSDSQVEDMWVSSRWARLEDIAPMMQMAVIAAEDQRFPTHQGLDFTELKKALSDSDGPKRGASTITQQLVKNLYLWPEKSLFRKAIEAYLALLMEVLLPKQRIVELYLNVVEFGPGTYGVTHAANAFFNKTPQQLNRVESSLLAAVLPNPKRLSVAAPSAYVYERALDIRFSIRNLGGTAYLKKIEPQQ